tara:strand:- start:64 stop:219 length:156 start_codon:yes stop_codon:yes gene_type:complete
MTIGFLPDITSPEAIEQAIASLAQGIYSINSELFIHALIKPLEKEHGTTNK